MKRNPFKALETNKQVPEELKSEIFKEIDSIKLLSDFVHLFSVKYLSVFESMFKTKK